MTWWDILKIGVPAVIAFLLGRLSKRLDVRSETRRADAAKAPAFRIERANKSLYRLLNVGTVDATGVTLDLGDFPRGFVRNVPDGIDLMQNANHEFFVTGSMQTPRPNQFFVACDQLDRPVPVAMPPR